MKKLYSTLIGLALLAPVTFAQKPEPPIHYAVSFPNAAHHEAEIVMTITKAPTGDLRLRVSRSSPGRYATHEFGKNVYNVKAFNVDGSPVVVKQLEGDLYVIEDHGEVVKVSYTLFGNWTDGTYASIDESHAHLNMPASFMFVTNPDQQQRLMKFEFSGIEKYGWEVATQLKHEGGNVYSAPNLQYMMDSPVELSNFKTTAWDDVNADGKKQSLSIATHTVDDQATIDNFATMVKKVTLEQKAVFGELPTFDYGTYVFLHDVYPTNSGDGMEHRNSTNIVDVADKIAGNELNMLGTFSHEFFHSWNVERIRPKMLEPFNFEHANMSNELWFAEGFTQYYGEMIITRAGYYTPEQYTYTLNGLVNAALNTPGAAKYPPTQASRTAVFSDAGVSVDANNYANTFTSYYTYGGATALALDLRLRSELKLTLDDYMKAVWLAHGKKMKPYTVADLQKVLATFTNNPKFAADFFNRYVNGIEKNDYAALLAKAGYLVRKAQPGKAWTGISATALRGRSGQARTVGVGFAITTNSPIGSPIYKAGIDAGDVILKADGKDIADGASFAEVVATKKPGDKVSISYSNRTGQHQVELVLEENPTFEVVTFEKAGQQPTADQLAFRNNWLSSKAK